MVFNHLTHNGKSHTGTFVFGHTVQTRKDIKKTLGINLTKANTITYSRYLE